MRRALTLLLASAWILTACSDDTGERAGADVTTSTVESTTTTTEAIPVDTTFLAEDVEGLCAELEALSDIDPGADPTQGDVDRLRSIADGAPPGVAQPLLDVAGFGQAVIDSGGEDPADVEELRARAAESATILIAYGNEACDIDVPLFDSIAGV